MKHLLLLIIAVATIWASANTEWVDGQIEAIKPPRSGISSSAVQSVANPFFKAKVKKEAKKGARRAGPRTTSVKKAPGTTKKADVKKKRIYKGLKLFAIMNNSALINGKWYKVNDKLYGYTLTNIEHVSVLLERGKKKRKLFITSDNKKIKIQTK